MKAALTWMYDNREWLFSGVGVVAATGLITFAIWWWSPKQSDTNLPTASIPSPHKVSYRRSPTSTEIMQTLEKAPPLETRDAANKYVGVPVEWERTIDAIRPIDGVDHIVFQWTQGAGWFYDGFSVPYEDAKHKHLKLDKPGQKYVVRGVIDRFATPAWTAVLRDAEIAPITEKPAQ